MINAITLDASGVTTIEAFKEWARKRIRPIIPHEAQISGHGHIHAAGVGLDYIVMIDYPADYLHGLRNRAGGIDSPILQRWIMTREPVMFDADNPWPDTSPEWLAGFRKHGLKNAIGHGVYDTERCVGTYHCFSRVAGSLDAAKSEAMKHLTPILHRVLCHVIELRNAQGTFTALLSKLSGREKEIVQWVRAGKSNGEIAAISALSENTVKHHMTRIFGKLEVQSRSQLLRKLAEHELRQTPGYGSTKIV